jgi:Ca-activated chloride channel homolog
MKTTKTQRHKDFFFLFFVLFVSLWFSSSNPGLAQSGRNRSAPRPKPSETAPGGAPKSSTPENSSTTPPIVRAEPGEDDPGEGATLKIDATLVTVPVVVSDQSGRYVPFLKSENFKLYEDGTAQEISFFASERVPFNVSIVLDTSGSISDSMEAIQESAIRFVRELRDDDRVMVIEFNSRVNVLNELTSDRYKIRHSIETTRSHGGTRLYDGLYEAAIRMKSAEGRKAIILLTDGEDTESNRSARDALESILESGALMYVIQFPASMGSSAPGGSIGMPPTFPGGGRGGGIGGYPDSEFLRELVGQTGGDMYYAGGRAGLPNVWRKIAEELRYVYVLGYYPTNPVENGGHRHIRVQLSQGTGKIRYKPGYSAAKQERKNHKDTKTQRN